MVDLMGALLGVSLVAAFTTLHFFRGQQWQPRENITQLVKSQRASTVAETFFQEPMSRASGAVVIGTSEQVESTGSGDESVSSELIQNSPRDIPDSEAKTFKVEYVKEGVTLDVRENQTLLEAGELQGWDMPYACREGQCLSCGGKITNGSASDFICHDGQEMLSSDELGLGYSLTCVAYPTSNMRLETNEVP